MCQVNEKAEILTPHSSHIFQPILMKLEIKKISGIRPNMQNVVDVGRREGGLRREGIFRYFLCRVKWGIFARVGIFTIISCAIHVNMCILCMFFFNSADLPLPLLWYFIDFIAFFLWQKAKFYNMQWWCNFHDDKNEHFTSINVMLLW